MFSFLIVSFLIISFLIISFLIISFLIISFLVISFFLNFPVCKKMIKHEELEKKEKMKSAVWDYFYFCPRLNKMFAFFVGLRGLLRLTNEF